MLHRLSFSTTLRASINDVFAALGETVAFRRWASPDRAEPGMIPAVGFRYRHQGSSVLREGRVVEVVRPVGLTLAETLLDPPCQVALKLRWRIEPVANGVRVRLQVSYRLNYAATINGAHWGRRLSLHFEKQLSFVAANTESLQRTA